MFALGHLGIGSKLVSPWSQGLPRRAVLLGTLLPDLIDKPLYYALVLITGLKGEELGLLSGTRTFGHTALLLSLILFSGVLFRSRALAGLALGVASHLVLDCIGDRMHPITSEPYGSAITAVLWPMLGWKFAVIPYESMQRHLGTLFNGWVFWGEIVGAGILSWDYWKNTHRPEIFEALQSMRTRLQKQRRRRRRGSTRP